MDMHDIGQWAMLVGFAYTLYRIHLSRKSDKAVDEEKIRKEAEEKTNMKRDITDVTERVSRLFERDDRIFLRLDGIDKKLGEIGVGIAVIETKLGIIPKAERAS